VPQQPPDRPSRSYDERRGARRAGFGPVPRPDPERAGRTEEPFDDERDPRPARNR
jgi:hypothetical protein